MALPLITALFLLLNLKHTYYVFTDCEFLIEKWSIRVRLLNFRPISAN